MALTLAQVTTRAADVLQDAANVRWTKAEIARWVSDAQRRVVDLVPAAYIVTVTVPLAITCQQVLPQAGTGTVSPGGATLTGTGTHLIDIIRNNKPDGSAPGRPVSKIDRKTLDQEDVNWHSAPANLSQGFVEYFVYEPDNDRANFYVYPKPLVAGVDRSATGQGVDIMISGDPPELTTPTNDNTALVIDPQFHECVIDYVVARAVSKDGESGNQMQRASAHMANFMTGLGLGPKRSADN